MLRRFIERCSIIKRSKKNIKIKKYDKIIKRLIEKKF
jgi:hypothetical protein